MTAEAPATVRVDTRPNAQAWTPAITRLNALTPLDARDLALLASVELEARRIPSRRELVIEGRAIPAPLIVLEGWACRVRLLADGRRQIISFVLPGELIGVGRQRGPVAGATVVALTNVKVGTLPPLDDTPPGSSLGQAYAIGAALDELFLLNQVTRLGRFDAYERAVDLLLELHDRFALAGLAMRGEFPLPLTQETLADALGLTSVHLNRTIQALRRDGMLTLQSGVAALQDMAGLAALLGRDRARQVLDSVRTG